MRKRLLALILGLVMCLSLLPVTAVFAADDTIINKLVIDYTTNNAYPGTRAYEVTKELRDCLYYKNISNGAGENVAYVSNVYFRSYTNPDRVGNSTQIEHDTPDLIDPNLYYFAKIEVEAKNGYDFKHTGTTFDTSSLTAVINGKSNVAEVSSGYNEYWKSINIWVPITIDTTYTVRSVSITNTDVNVEKGGTVQFTSDAVYYGTGYNAVNWSVTGANNAGTRINSSGLLTVAAGETAKTITVKATAAKDSSKFDTRVLSVIDRLYIDSVSLDTKYADIFVGFSQTFKATVVGTDTHEVNWVLSGNNSASTTLTVDGDKCTVNVAADETSDRLQLTANAVKDPVIRDTAFINVMPLSNINKLVINYTTDNATDGTVAYEVTKELRDCLLRKNISNGAGENVAHVSNVYFRSYTNPDRVGASTQIEYATPDLLDPNLYYFVNIQVEANKGYDFKHTGTTFDTSSLTTVINGKTNVAEVSSGYNEYWKLIDIWVPIEIKDATIRGDINGNGSLDDADLTALLRHVAQIELITDSEALGRANIDGIGDIDAADVTALAQMLKK